jgi:hypothetical protein
VYPYFIPVICQVVLLAYHQATTLLDFFPFNGARHYNRKEKLAEAGVNAVLMALPPVGFLFHVRALMVFGVVYYFVLFAFELMIWWVPYLTTPTGALRRVYNFLLSIATSDFGPGDALDRWREVYERLHSSTIRILPRRAGRIVPNLEHTILHAWTLITALVTAYAFCRA